MYKKSDPIFRFTTPSTGQRLGEVVVGTLYILGLFLCMSQRAIRCGNHVLKATQASEKVSFFVPKGEKHEMQPGHSPTGSHTRPFTG